MVSLDLPSSGSPHTFLTENFLCLDSFTSSQALSKYGVLQGSILGPILFSLYLLPLDYIIKQNDISFHCYTDDTQLYLSCKPSGSAKLSSLHNCLAMVKDWMAVNFLQFNSSKMEILIIAPEHTHGQVLPALGSLAQHVVPTLKNLGVILDHNLESHIKSLR